MGDFKKLIVWKRSRLLIRRLYDATGRFPAAEALGLTSQIRRAGVSVSANIAEGAGRATDRDQARCYGIALSSARELENLIILSADLELLKEQDREDLAKDVDEIERMLYVMIRRVSNARSAQRRAQTAG